MAIRYVYVPDLKSNYIKLIPVEFKWNGGFSLTQKQKNIQSLHNAFKQIDGNQNKKILEVSSKSPEDLGKKLSAFNLLKYVPSLDKKLPVECCFQSGKIFENGGPFLDLLSAEPAKAKKDPRLFHSGKLIAFQFENHIFPLEPKTRFYDYLYISALKENKDLANLLLTYDGFTDIEFNPARSINCQARSCALFVSNKKSQRL